jgi:hypothetical protein
MPPAQNIVDLSLDSDEDEESANPPDLGFFYDNVFGIDPHSSGELTHSDLVAYLAEFQEGGR